MTQKSKSIIAFAILGAVIISGFVLKAFDKSTDVLPTADTTGTRYLEYLDERSLAFGKTAPYKLGISITGIIFLLMLFIPNIIWAKKGIPAGYEDATKNENKILLWFERIGQVIVSASLLIFTATNPHIKILPEGLFFDWGLIFWITAFVLMIFYECYWIRYFKSGQTMKDFYSSFAGFPLAGATLPVIAVLLLGFYSCNLVIICGALVLGIGHIGIHLGHWKEIKIP